MKNEKAAFAAILASYFMYCTPETLPLTCKNLIMENFYTCYTKVLQGTTYYFAKKYITFPEHNNVPDVLDGYGMHTDFEQACKIAKIEDAAIKEMLLLNLREDPLAAKVIRMDREVRKAN